MIVTQTSTFTLTFGLHLINGDNCDTDFHFINENSERVKITQLKMTGDNEGYLHYTKYRGETFICNGIAFCNDIDVINLDDDDSLTEECRLSGDGLTIFSTLNKS